MTMAPDRPGTTLHFPSGIRQAFLDMPGYPMVIVEAPMGYGKTTAIRAYLAQQHGQTRWMRLFDDNPVSFWQDFCSLFSSDDSTAAARMALLQPEDATAIRTLVRMLAEMPLPRPLRIVIDDYHLASCPHIDTWFTRLAETGIEGLQIILATRTNRLTACGELRLKGLALLVGKRAFEFSSTDITAYCQLNGVTPQKREAEALRKWSEGWISALYLALMAHREKGRWDTEGSIDELMRNAVYEPLSSGQQRLLRCMSLFDRFTSDQAVQICNDPEAGTLLAELVLQNTFIQLDPASGELHIHNLFNAFLKERLRQDPMTDVATLHSRAGDWFSSQHAPLAAMRHFLAAGNHDALLQVMEADRGTCLRADQKPFLLQVLQACPEEALSRHPVALLVAALCLTTFGEMERAVTLATRVAAYVAEGRYPPEEMNHVAAELTLFSSFGLYNDANAMIRCCREAAAICPKPVRFLDTSGSWAFDAPSVQYMFHREPGRLQETVSMLKTGLRHYNELTRGHGTGADWMLEAEAHYLRGNAVEAEISATRARYEAEKAHQPDIVIMTLFLRARIAMTSGRIEDMHAHLDAMTAVMSERGMWSLASMQALCQGYLYGCLRQPDKIPEWLSSEEEVFRSRLYVQAYGFAWMVHARALLLRQAHLRLIGLSEGMLEEAAVFPSQAVRLQILLCRAAANEMAFRHEQALRDLTLALEEAEPDDILMPFAENADLCRSLLEKLHARNIHRSFIARIMNLMTTVLPAMDLGIHSFSDVSRPCLSEREAQVAALAAEGRSNREIGSQLHITENTVKTILKSVFDKLDIHSRALLTGALAGTHHQIFIVPAGKRK